MLKIVILALSASLCYAGSTQGGQIIRPCNLKDYKCIGDNLAANSNCNRQVSGFIPNQFVVPSFRFETPHFNASYIEKNLIVRNHDRCFVSEFFFNMKTDTSVLSVDCPNMGFETDRTLIQHFSKREDQLFSYHIRSVYPLVRFTVNLNHAEKLDICSAFTFSDVTTLPIFNINPNDAPTANFLSRDLSALYIYERESFFYRGPPIVKRFVNNYICDFHCN